MKRGLIYSFLLFISCLFLGITKVNAQSLTLKEFTFSVGDFSVNSIGVANYTTKGSGLMNITIHPVINSDGELKGKSLTLIMDVCAGTQIKTGTFESQYGNSLTIVNLYSNCYNGQYQCNSYRFTYVFTLTHSVGGPMEDGSFVNYSSFANDTFNELYSRYNWNVLFSVKSANLYFTGSAELKQMEQNQEIIDKTQQTNDKLDEINNSDISDKDKEMPDDSKFQDYNDAENTLKDKMNEADLSGLSVGIDANSSEFVWDTLTDFIKSHSVVFGLYISILTIGIIKLALGR